MNSLQSVLSEASAAAAPLWPKLAAAITIVVVACWVARLARGVVARAGTRYSLDQRLGSAGFTVSVASVGAALIWLMALPALLGTLELQGLLTPVNALTTRLMSFIPNLMGAAVLLGLGLLVARILSQVVAGLLRAAGSEAVAQIGTALLRLSMAALILVAGMLVANAAAKRVHAQTGAAQRPQADLLAALMRGAILFFVAALALHHAGLPAVIVSIAFGAVVGGLTIGLAVAMGVGGGPAATRLWQRAVDSFEPSPVVLAHPPSRTASEAPPEVAAQPAASTSESHATAAQACTPLRLHPPGPAAARPCASRPASTSHLWAAWYTASSGCRWWPR